jgi:molybdate transport system regulatory protein
MQLADLKKKKSKINRMALLRLIRDHGSISAAAKILGISYKAAWEAVEEVNGLSAKPLLERSVGGEKGGGTILTEHGLKVMKHIEHFEEAFQDFLEILGADDDARKEFRFYTSVVKLKTSSRNQFGGRVAEITKGPLSSEVILDIGDGCRVVGVLANKSVDDLELKVGTEAFALIKASSVIVAPGLGFKSSARNQFSGVVSRCEEGEVNSEVIIELPGGKSIAALITNVSHRNLGLKVGDQATALVKASQTHIILAED